MILLKEKPVLMSSGSIPDNSQKRTEEIISLVINILKKHLNEFSIYLFGSRAKGRNSKYADIDLALDTNCNNKTFEEIKTEIDEIKTLFTIDLINLCNADPEFKKIIYNTGKILYVYKK